MDDAMMSALMKSHGAANTAENGNRIREFYANNPQLAEHRAMGMRGSINDDNSDLLTGMLDKLIAQTDGVAVGKSGASAVAEPQVSMPQKVVATPPGKLPAAGAKEAPNWANASENPNLGPVPARNASAGERGAAQGRVSGYETPPDLSGQNGDGKWDWLLPALGLAAARRPAPTSAPGTAVGEAIRPEATFVGRMGDVARRDPRAAGYLSGPQDALAGPNAKLYAPNGQLTDMTPRGNFEDVGKDMQTVQDRNATSKNAKETQMRSEVDAENEALRMKQERADQALMDQMRTRKLGEAARRATGRR